MIKSTKVSLKFTNTTKLKHLDMFISEYKIVVSKFVDLLWNLDNVPILLPKEISSQVDTWLSARMVQCAGKQASGIVRGTKKKQAKRIWMANKLLEQGHTKRAKKLQQIINSVQISKPNIDNIEPELDSRFVDIEFGGTKCFDGWVTLSSIGNKLKIVLPIKKTKHFNKMLCRGTIKTGIRLSGSTITFMFDLPDVEVKTNGDVVGIDIGQLNVITCSNNHISGKCVHGHDLDTITTRLTRCKRGSNGFRRISEHRKNYINMVINRLNLNGLREIKIERIRNMRRGKRSSRRLSHWTYADIFSKLKMNCLEQGVLVSEISPTYTSKRCSGCGWTRRSNRKGKLFKCGHCGLSLDADLNASINIGSNLKPISYKKRHLHDIRTGFFWNEDGEMPIVSPVHKINQS